MDYKGLYQDLLQVRDKALRTLLLHGVDFDAAFAFAAECGDFRLDIEQRGLLK